MVKMQKEDVVKGLVFFAIVNMLETYNDIPAEKIELLATTARKIGEDLQSRNVETSAEGLLDQAIELLDI